MLASRSYTGTGGNDDTVRTIALPSGAVINAWPYTWEIDPYATDISLSSSGQLLGQVVTGPGPARQVTASSGGPLLWSDVGTEPIRLSLDDTLIAAASGASGSIQTTTKRVPQRCPVHGGTGLER